MLKKTILILIGIFLLAFVLVHYQQSRKRDRTLAEHIYQELVVIDEQLNNLQESATFISQQKQINLQIFEVAKGVNKDNFMERKPALLNAANTAIFNTFFQTKIESEIQATTHSNIKKQLHLIKNTLHELKYNQNKQIDNFNQQIIQINSKLSLISLEVEQVKDADLHDLELAKLRFIIHKLSITTEKLHEAFYKQVIDDIIDTFAIDDAEK